MIIRCKKEEFADIVAMCRSLDRCSGCVLAGICKMEEQGPEKASHQRLTELVEIEEDDEECHRITGPGSGLLKRFEEEYLEMAKLKFAPYQEIEEIKSETAKGEAAVR